MRVKDYSPCGEILRFCIDKKLSFKNFSSFDFHFPSDSNFEDGDNTKEEDPTGAEILPSVSSR